MINMPGIMRYMLPPFPLIPSQPAFLLSHVKPHGSTLELSLVRILATLLLLHIAWELRYCLRKEMIRICNQLNKMLREENFS